MPNSGLHAKRDKHPLHSARRVPGIPAAIRLCMIPGKLVLDFAISNLSLALKNSRVSSRWSGILTKRVSACSNRANAKAGVQQDICTRDD